MRRPRFNLSGICLSPLSLPNTHLLCGTAVGPFRWSGGPVVGPSHGMTGHGMVGVLSTSLWWGLTELLSIWGVYDGLYIQYDVANG